MRVLYAGSRSVHHCYDLRAAWCNDNRTEQKDNPHRCPPYNQMKLFGSVCFNQKINTHLINTFSAWIGTSNPNSHSKYMSTCPWIWYVYLFLFFIIFIVNLIFRITTIKNSSLCWWYSNDRSIRNNKNVKWKSFVLFYFDWYFLIQWCTYCCGNTWTFNKYAW
jgi:hypothetical protein